MANFFKKDDTLLTPANCTLLLVDYQPQMLFTVKSMDSEPLMNNAVGLAKTAKIFNLPTIVTSIAHKSFNGKLFTSFQRALSNQENIERSNLNPWEDTRVVEAIRKTKREKLVIAGLWTEICVALPAIKALESGYTVYVVADACGGTTKLSHQMAMQRMIQAGAIPITWLQLLLELQRDLAREATCAEVLDLAMEHGGTYGLGIDYAPQKTKSTTPIDEASFVI